MADIIREITHDDDGKPILILRKKDKPKNTFKLINETPDTFAIRLNDIWMYSEEHNPTTKVAHLDQAGNPHIVAQGFEPFMFQCTEFLCELFGLGLATPRKMAEIATIIQEGIDDLVKLPPQQKRIQTIGEVRMESKTLINGKVDGGFIHHGPINDAVSVKG